MDMSWLPFWCSSLLKFEKVDNICAVHGCANWLYVCHCWCRLIKRFVYYCETSQIIPKAKYGRMARSEHAVLATSVATSSRRDSGTSISDLNLEYGGSNKLERWLMTAGKGEWTRGRGNRCKRHSKIEWIGQREFRCVTKAWHPPSSCCRGFHADAVLSFSFFFFFSNTCGLFCCFDFCFIFDFFPKPLLLFFIFKGTLLRIWLCV